LGPQDAFLKAGASGRLRSEGRRMPIIVLAGADAEADVVRGLDA
jgi:DNA-binding response OmpR family regulator